MPCYSPLTGYRARYLNDNGKRPVVFNVKDGFKDMSVQVPCGQCIGCRLEYSRQWAIRCVHEAQMHDTSSFITLTYNNESLPNDWSVSKRVFQLFMKRLRKRLCLPIRFFACGEYGEICSTCGEHQTKCFCRIYKASLGRPHYHAIIFGYDFPDKLLHTKKNGNLLYHSPFLAEVWPYGFNIIGDVTFESCAYVARYIMKKQKGKDAPDYYEKIHTQTGELCFVEKEFCLMSRMPGLGATWLEKFKSDTDKDFITIRGKRMSLPKYYDSLLEKIDGEDSFEQRKLNRRKEACKVKEDNTYYRLLDREQVKLAQLDFLKRDMEF